MFLVKDLAALALNVQVYGVNATFALRSGFAF